MTQRVRFGAMAAAAVCLVCGLLAFAQNSSEESERRVKESEVPRAALAALKKLAAGAAITEFAEEIEHGHKFYEGSWKGKHGNVDGLVTESGDVVEIEEKMPGEKVPSIVRAELKKAAGDGVPVEIERKTVFVYEGHFKKDGKESEMLLTADGRPYHGEDEQAADNDGGDED